MKKNVFQIVSRNLTFVTSFHKLDIIVSLFMYTFMGDQSEKC